MNKKALMFVLVLLTTVAFSAVAPAFAKDFNVPEDAVRNYWTGGTGKVEVPSTWPPGGWHRSSLVIYAQHVEAGTYGTGDSITIFVPYSSFILPVACFCTNANEALFEAQLRAGTPAGVPGNTRKVSDLSVERHGNSITIQLNEAQTIKWPKPGFLGFVPATIPAFTIELEKVGGSVHTYTEVPLSKSGYLVCDDNMGFLAEGAITCLDWNYDEELITECKIVMHGINTNIPPPPT